MIKIRFIQATMTALIEALHHAYATGNLRAVKRISALLDVAKDESVENVARKYDVARQTVHRWVTELLLAGLDSLKYEKSSGRKPRLTKAQKARLKEVVKAGPPAAGFQTACWTSLLIQMVIYREFKVFYSRHYVCELLHNLGFSFQKARFVSDHLDEKRRREWMEKEWPKILRQAKKRRAYLLKVLAETTRQLVIIQEGARYHTSKAMRQFFAAHQDRITGYQLPSYSPDYNPIEYLWKNVKREATHNQYFPEFELLTLSVDQALAYYAQHPGEVKSLMGMYCQSMAAGLPLLGPRRRAAIAAVAAGIGNHLAANGTTHGCNLRRTKRPHPLGNLYRFEHCPIPKTCPVDVADRTRYNTIKNDTGYSYLEVTHVDNQAPHALTGGIRIQRPLGL